MAVAAGRVILAAVRWLAPIVVGAATPKLIDMLLEDTEKLKSAKSKEEAKIAARRILSEARDLKKSMEADGTLTPDARKQIEEIEYQAQSILNQ